MNKYKLVVANWKMNPETIKEAKFIFNSTNKKTSTLKNVKIVVCPPAIFLANLTKSKIAKNFFWGAQNIFGADRGAYTGELSVSMFKNLGVSHVILGHSERRALGESDEFISEKVKHVSDAGLIPIVCLGEKDRDRDGVYLEFISNQIKKDLSKLRKKDLIGITIAYEPIWAIGKSYIDSMQPSDIHETVLFIRKILSENFGKDVSISANILYGGSVESQNVEQIIKLGHVQGLLVGHDSLVPEDFCKILDIVDRAK